MENRDRKWNSDESSSSSEDRKSEPESSFGKNIGSSEDWNSEPSRTSGSGDMQSDKGRSSSDLESDLGSSKGYNESGNVNRGSSNLEH